MLYPRILMLYIALSLIPLQALAKPDNTQLAVWANEAIVATYTYNYQNFMVRQQEIAKYFTAKGWIAYSKALEDAKLLESVQKNKYDVSAVATHPPTIKLIGTNQWQAQMPLLVIYKNPQYQQKQTLDITLNFAQSPEGLGIRGLSIDSLRAVITQPFCQCMQEPPMKALV